MKKAFPLLKCSGSEVTHVIFTHILWVSTYHMVPPRSSGKDTRKVSPWAVPMQE